MQTADSRGFRLHYRPRSGERFALEIPIPGRKPGEPTRFAGFGAIATAPSNAAVGAPPMHRVQLPDGSWFKPARQRREAWAGGRKGPALPVAGAAIERASIDSEFDAAMLVERALITGELIWRGRRVRVIACEHSPAIRTIPDKGAVLKWADRAALVEAIALGLF